MNVMKTVSKAFDVVRLAQNLRGATDSRVTRTQTGATFAVCLVVAGLAMIPGSPLADFSVAMAAVTLLVPLLAPLLSRAFGRKDKGSELSVSEALDELALLLERKEARAAGREEDAALVAQNRDELLRGLREARARNAANHGRT